MTKQSDGHPSSERGFTLVEVVVAIAILALTMGVLFNVISDSLRAVGNVEKRLVGVSIAQSFLAELGTSIPLDEGQSSGEFAGGFNWRLVTLAYGEAADRQSWPATVYNVQAEISWSESGHKRSYSLTTLRLGRKGEKR